MSLFINTLPKATAIKLESIPDINNQTTIETKFEKIDSYHMKSYPDKTYLIDDSFSLTNDEKTKCLMLTGNDKTYKFDYSQMPTIINFYFKEGTFSLLYEDGGIHVFQLNKIEAQTICMPPYDFEHDGAHTIATQGNILVSFDHFSEKSLQIWDIRTKRYINSEVFDPSGQEIAIDGNTIVSYSNSEHKIYVRKF